MFMLHGRLGAKSGKREELLQVFVDAEHQAPLPGCRLYLVATDQTDVDGVWVTEVWESEEAHAASLQIGRVKEQIARAMPLLDLEGFTQQRLDARVGIP
ncbi:MAG TPA: antibiotic biosynthesis monooxygenase family protein [Nocardioidaceae bacterium]|jgi:quinol monooxygenase YgiN|nr:antibiotic biosynthesis monooxygenase family protein [Nocardioidaceae bacterium]